MDFENRNSFGSVRRLRDRFEQNNLDVKLNNDINCDKNRNCIKIKDVFCENEEKKRCSASQTKQINSIDKSFTEKLNKTLSNENKLFNNTNFRLTKSTENPLITENNGPEVYSLTNKLETEINFSAEPNPVPKPPRTFAHDVYLELKFKTNSNNNNNNNNLDKKLTELYSQPNKANKTKNRLRSQSDSKVIENKKSTEFKSNENIYDDCINTRNIDKTLKSKLMQFSCLKLKRH